MQPLPLRLLSKPQRRGCTDSGHLSAAIKSYARAEWDHCEVEGIDSSLYSVENGHVDLPDVPGFGLKLDEEIFQAAVAAEGGVSVQGAGFQP